MTCPRKTWKITRCSMTIQSQQLLMLWGMAWWSWLVQQQDQTISMYVCQFRHNKPLFMEHYSRHLLQSLQYATYVGSFFFSNLLFLQNWALASWDERRRPSSVMEIQPTFTFFQSHRWSTHLLFRTICSPNSFGWNRARFSVRNFENGANEGLVEWGKGLQSGGSHSLTVSFYANVLFNFTNRCTAGTRNGGSAWLVINYLTPILICEWFRTRCSKD